MSKINLKNRKENGYTVLELLFYIAFFAVLSLVVINAMITMARSFKETTIQANLAQSGTIMERISREIRQANSIVSISPDKTDLILNTGANKTMEFKLVGSDVQILDNGSNIGNLNSPNTTVSGLIFTQISTAKSKAVKISLTVHDVAGNTADFQDTVVLRGSY